VLGAYPTAGSVGCNPGAPFVGFTGTRWLLTSRASSGNETTCSAAELRQDIHFLATNRYRDLKVPSESEFRHVMLESLSDIERAVADALAEIIPSQLVCGHLTSQTSLTVVDYVTTWSLTPFEPVCAWSGAEDLTAVKEQESYGIA
jgi:hypothetical protein